MRSESVQNGGLDQHHAEGVAEHPAPPDNRVEPGNDWAAPGHAVPRAKRLYPDYQVGDARERRYPRHALSAIFPPLTSEEFDQLLENIAEIGQSERIVVYDGQIIDGFHRDEICYILGVEAKYRHLSTATDTVAFVLGQNLHGRHMTSAQRSLVVASLPNRPRGRVDQERTAHGAHSSASAGQASLPITKPKNQIGINTDLILADPAKAVSDVRAYAVDPASRQYITNRQAAELAGVSTTSVQLAKKIIESGNEAVLHAVGAGMSAQRATAILKLPVDDQHQAIQDFRDGKKRELSRKEKSKEDKAAIAQSKKSNDGVDLTGIVLDEIPQALYSRVASLLKRSLEFAKKGFANEYEVKQFQRVLVECRFVVEAGPGLLEAET